MKKPKTLNEVKQLEESGFGQLYPRHGLKLLYWFANDCLYFDDHNEMCWQYDPEDGSFGFHLFENRNDKNGDKLLPDVNQDYYEVGNLRRAGAKELPYYVRKDYTHEHCDSNKDRIIVSIDDECFERVYVTEHSDRTHFNKEATYCISRGLIMIIRQLTLDDFLSETGYRTLQEDTDQSSTEDDNDDTDQGTGDSTLPVDTYLNTGSLRLVKDSDQSSKEEGGFTLSNEEIKNKCGCIIL